jgi:hypothetical protein
VVRKFTLAKVRNLLPAKAGGVGQQALLLTLAQTPVVVAQAMLAHRVSDPTRIVINGVQAGVSKGLQPKKAMRMVLRMPGN